jgi:hypothetical protein
MRLASEVSAELQSVEVKVMSVLPIFPVDFVSQNVGFKIVTFIMTAL